MGYDIYPAVNIAAVVAGYRRRSLPIGGAVYETGGNKGLGIHRQEATILGGGNLVARAERIGFGSVHYFIVIFFIYHFSPAGAEQVKQRHTI